MLNRALTDVIAKSAEKMPVITIIGPRQSGKTTLARATFPDKAYFSLESPANREAARSDPEGVLARFPKGVIFDEVQRAPDLLSYIQVAVDENDMPGRFVLTGSQNFLLMQTVSQTLAGRTALLTLLPFSVRELTQLAPVDPRGLMFVEEETEPGTELWQTLWTGLYPRIHDKGLDPGRWLADYHRTYVERDVRDVLKVMDVDGFERFVRLAAARTGQELNYASLAADAGISQPTARQWMTTLRVSSLVTLLLPHHQNYRKRLRKRPKLHFLDTGLVCYLLGIHSPSVLRNHPLRGAIFESFVVSELTKAFVHRGLEAPLYHWRDATGHEVDVIVDLGDRLVPVEVKSSVTLGSHVFDGLRWWTGIGSNPTTGGMLVHGGKARHEQDGFSVRPWWIW
ncbi:MAG: ATP-binding protein [Deltaproteobacteria bacterium]|nr:ATP-binding protein [Deltaproteobacteria bacterium]